jgi:hypothetical protein
VGVPNAPPASSVGVRPRPSGTVEQPKGPNVDLSDIDPLAPRYQEWEERAKQYKTVDTVKAETLPFGGDRLGRDVLAKAIKGAEVSILVGVLAAVLATLIGTVLGALSGFFGGKIGDFLEWVYNVFTAIPGILLIFAFAAIFGKRCAVGGADPRPRRLARHLPPDARRVHEALGARVRAFGRGDRRQQDERACSGTSCPMSRTWRWCSCRCMWWRSSRARSSCPIWAWESAWTRSPGARCWQRARAN